jgi:hypothetical protein
MAANKCQEALDSEKDSSKEKLWKAVFGRPFPRTASVQKSAYSGKVATTTTEEFIEDEYPVDIQYDVRIECDVSHNRNDVQRLKWLERIFPISIGKRLRFHIAYCSVPAPYDLMWKVRNVGEVAERRGIRGQLLKDEGKQERVEKTDFPGPHFVECYVRKDGVCVARDRFDTPIGEG